MATILAVVLAVQTIGRAGPAVQRAGVMVVEREACRAGRVNARTHAKQR